MKRRDLLVGSAVGAATLSATASAKSSDPQPPTYDPAVVEAALERIDRRMSMLSQSDFGVSDQAKVARAGLRSLYFVGAFMELDEHQRVHPGVQERMRRMQPEMNTAIGGMA